MSSSQMQELQKMQRLQQQMQSQLRQQQQQTSTGGHQQQQMLGQNGGLGGLSQGMQAGMQGMQFPQSGSQQGWMDLSQQTGVGGVQGSGGQNQISGAGNAALLPFMQQQQQRQMGNQFMGMGGGAGNSQQAALYLNALQAKGQSAPSGTMGGVSGGSATSLAGLGGMNNSMNNPAAMQQMLRQQQQQRGSMGQQNQQVGQAQMNRRDSSGQQQNMPQQQHMQQQQSPQVPKATMNASNLGMPGSAGKSGNPADFLAQQQKMIADLKRQLEAYQQGTVPPGGGTNQPSTSTGMSNSLMQGQQQQPQQQSMSNSLLQGQQQQQMPNSLMQGQQQQQPQQQTMSNTLQQQQQALLLMQQQQQQQRGNRTSMPGQLQRQSSVGSQGPSDSTMMQQLAGSGQLQGMGLGDASHRSSTSSFTGMPGTGGSDPSPDANMLMQQQQATMQQQQLHAAQQQALMGQSQQKRPSSAAGRTSTVSPHDLAALQQGDSAGASSSSKMSIVEKSNRAQMPKNSRTSPLGNDSGSAARAPAPAGKKTFLQGTFEGGWQSNADLPNRRRVILSIVQVIEEMRPDARKLSQKLPLMAKRLEEHLYRSAKSKEEYLDPLSLKRRLQMIAHGLEVHRSSLGDGDSQSVGSQSLGERSQSQPQNNPPPMALGNQNVVNQVPPDGLRAVSPFASQPGNAASSGRLSQTSQSSALTATAWNNRGGILKTSSSKFQDPGSTQNKKAIRYQQQRLLLLRHASKCSRGTSCTTKHCQQMVSLWRHMKRCRDKTCKTAHCLSSRCVLNHYRICKNENKTGTCEVCAPVMRFIKGLNARAHREAEAGGRSLESPDFGSSEALDAMADQTNSMPAPPVPPQPVLPPPVPPPPVPPQPVPPPAAASAIAQQPKSLEDLRNAQEKLQQQQRLLKQLQQQESQLMEQQKILQQQRERVLPNTKEAMELRQQQVLLEQLQKQFEKQQFLLQQELFRQSNTVLGEGRIEDDEPLPLVPDIMPEASQSQPGSKRTKSPRGPTKKKRKKVSNDAVAKDAFFSTEVAAPDISDSHSLSSKRSVDDLSMDMSSVGSPHTSTKVRNVELMSQKEPKAAKGAVVESAPPTATAAVAKDAKDKTPEPTASLLDTLPIASVERHLISLQGRLNLSSRAISQKCLPLMRKLLSDPFGWVFRDPVDPDALGLPDYYEVVKHPMNLLLVEKKLESAEYADMSLFERDTRLVFENAILYNGEESEVGGMAKSMLLRFTRDYSEILLELKGDPDSVQPNGDICSLCGTQRRLFEPAVLYCNGDCGMQRIRRNATYYTDRSKSNHWCGPCYNGLKENEAVILEDGSEISKDELQKFKNDALPQEAWVQCDKCDGWVHQICTLFNGRKNKTAASFCCPKCLIAKKVADGEDATAESDHVPKEAKDLPHCKMSIAIEKGLEHALEKAYAARALEIGVGVKEVEKAEELSVRVVSSMDKKHFVRDEMFKRYENNGCPSEYPVRTKCILLFQKIHGIDVLLFGMYVYEYDHSCPAPNRRRVYISYLDSVQYFEPKCYRTTAYHSVLIEYLRYVKERGFHTAHIWSCPPSPGDDYIIHCHPKQQLIPRDEMLCAWYHDMLKEAQKEGVVLGVKTLYNEYFANSGMDATAAAAVDPTCLPYFDGDYIPGELENIIKELKKEEKGDSSGRRKSGSKTGTRSNPGSLVSVSQDKVMLRLGIAISNMQDNFMVVELLSRKFAAAVERGDDVSAWIEDEIESSSKKKRVSDKETEDDTPESVAKGLDAHVDELVQKETPKIKLESDGQQKEETSESASRPEIASEIECDAKSNGDVDDSKSLPVEQSQEERVKQEPDVDGEGVVKDVTDTATDSVSIPQPNPEPPSEESRLPGEGESPSNSITDDANTQPTNEKVDASDSGTAAIAETLDASGDGDPIKNSPEPEVGKESGLINGSSNVDTLASETVTQAESFKTEPDTGVKLEEMNPSSTETNAQPESLEAEPEKEIEVEATKAVTTETNSEAESPLDTGANLEETTPSSTETNAQAESLKTKPERESELEATKAVTTETNIEGESALDTGVKVEETTPASTETNALTESALDTGVKAEETTTPSTETNVQAGSIKTEQDRAGELEEANGSSTELNAQTEPVKTEEVNGDKVQETSLPSTEMTEAVSSPDKADEAVPEKIATKDNTETEKASDLVPSEGGFKRRFDPSESTASKSAAKPVGTTVDEDEPQESEMFETRQQFLNYCQANHVQFDELRRAKHSTMMVLFQLHNPSAPKFLQQCGACYRDITHGIRYHCNDCSSFDLCEDCYEPVVTGLWAQRDERFAHDEGHTFVPINMEATADSQKSREERARTIKKHLELLAHAASCEGPPTCSLNNCQRMKKLFEHVHSCRVTPKKSCKVCSRLLALLSMHARLCTARGSCPLPFCDRIRERTRRLQQQQQLMDDRRREAQNHLYRRGSA